jgi:hypothetical protein
MESRLFVPSDGCRSPNQDGIHVGRVHCRRGDDGRRSQRSQPGGRIDPVSRRALG